MKFLTSRWVAPLLVVLSCMIWVGVAGVQLNGDDYQYLHSLAPMRSIADALRPWVEHDANPHYFRPLANTTMVLNFLLSGWDGRWYHVTNLLFHLLASVLVYFAALSVFRITRAQALISAILFAVIASHEYNLVVDTARADELVTIFGLAAMIAIERWRSSRSSMLLATSVLMFALAMTSKEVGLFFLSVLLWQIVRENRERRSTYLPIFLFVVVSVLFFVYHAHFTMLGASQNDLIADASLSGILKNAAYTIGYFILPIEQETALTILKQEKLLLGAFGIAAAIVLWFALTSLSREDRQRLILPLLLAVATGFVSFLTFERWRLYPPSVGAVVAIVILFSAFSRRSKTAKAITIVIAVVLLGYHVDRAIAAQSNWRESTAMMQSLKADLSRLLSTRADRPLALTIVDMPAKLGSAGVMILGSQALAQQADAERTNAPGLRYGLVDTSSVSVDAAVMVYALDRGNGFAGLTVSKIGQRSDRVSAPATAGIRFIPSALGKSAIRSSQEYSAGDTVGAIRIDSVLNDARETGLRGTLLDSLAIPVVFDGRLHSEPVQ